MSVRANVDRTRLNERITFRRRTDTPDTTTGRLTTTWANLTSCWAAVDGQKASDRHREPQLASATQSFSEYTVWVRADLVQRYAITDKDQIVWRARVFNIKDIPDQQLRGRLLAVFCTMNRAD